ncbi:MAG: hypothetical protein C0448_05570 [Sphingobacteriaceae bacterium]|nr:hypothetical protein [Sphingobacteriaceae bacterium]
MNSTAPFFSIIIATFNRPKLVERAVQSVLSQSFQDFEIQIIDDGSEKNYETVIQLFKNDKRVNYYKQANEYLPSARNKGIELAKGEWICFLDDDDYYLQNHLEVLKNLITKHNFEKAIYRTFTLFEDENNIRSSQQISKIQGNQLEYIINNTITVNNVCLHRCLLINNLFEPSLRIAEDYNLWLRLLCRFRLFEAPEYTTVYFKSNNTMSSYNLISSEKYLISYFFTFSNKDVNFYLKHSVQKRLLLRYTYWYFDCAIKEMKSINFQLIFKIFKKYPSFKIFLLYTKYILKRFFAK